jgi:hypothetical protein
LPSFFDIDNNTEKRGEDGSVDLIQDGPKHQRVPLAVLSSHTSNGSSNNIVNVNSATSNNHKRAILTDFSADDDEW